MVKKNSLFYYWQCIFCTDVTKKKAQIWHQAEKWNLLCCYCSRSSSAAVLPGCSPSPEPPSGPDAPPPHTHLETNTFKILANISTKRSNWSILSALTDTMGSCSRHDIFNLYEDVSSVVLFNINNIVLSDTRTLTRSGSLRNPWAASCCSFGNAV